MAKRVITSGAIAVMIATYMYLGWSFLQILGAAFVLGMAVSADERGPVWRKSLWVALSFSLMVLAHFVIDDNSMYWGALLLACVLLMISVSSLHALVTAERGAGSALTAYFLGFIIFLPISIYVFYVGMAGLGYW